MPDLSVVHHQFRRPGELSFRHSRPLQASGSGWLRTDWTMGPQAEASPGTEWSVTCSSIPKLRRLTSCSVSWPTRAGTPRPVGPTAISVAQARTLVGWQARLFQGPIKQDVSALPASGTDAMLLATRFPGLRCLQPCQGQGAAAGRDFRNWGRWFVEAHRSPTEQHRVAQFVERCIMW